MWSDAFEVLWVFAPILGGAITHGPVLRFDLFPSLKKPLDFGASAGGNRIFGDNKTWRGAVSIIAGVMLAAWGLSFWPQYQASLPPQIQKTHPLVFGALLGLGFVIGELPNSFSKRRLGIAPGQQRKSAAGILLSIYDQGDFVFGVWITLAPIWVMTPTEALVAFSVSVVVHMIINVIGYWIGARKSWI